MLKLTKKNLDEAIEDLKLDQVREIMTALDWKWTGDDEPPSIIRLVRTIESLFEGAVVQANKHPEEKIVSVSSGGFEISIIRHKEYDTLLIFFGLESRSYGE